VTNSAAHHKPQIEISVWLDREATKCAALGHGVSEKAARLREAATLIRKQRADLVAARLGQRAAKGAR
jgi:hypothetical protein